MQTASLPQSSGQIPSVGMTMNVYGQSGVIVKVYRLGTVDVRVKSGQVFRVSGLPFVDLTAPCK